MLTRVPLLLLVALISAIAGCADDASTIRRTATAHSTVAVGSGLNDGGRPTKAQSTVSKSTDNPEAIRPACYDLPGDPFGNPSGSSVTFDEAIAATLQADPRLRSGYESVVQAHADLWTSKILPNPSLLVDGIFLPVSHPFTPESPGGPPQTDVQVTWQIDWFLFGKRAAGITSASLAVRQSEADYADLIRTRVLATATAYYDVLEAKGLVDAARKDTENLKTFADVLEKAGGLGGRPQIDLERARLELLKSQQGLREAESNLVAAKAKLRDLMGRADADPNFDVAGSLDTPLDGEPPSADAAFELAQQNRPDIASLRLQVSKAQADVVVERRKAFPQVTPMLGWSRQYQTVALRAPDADSLTTSLSVTLPMFDRNQGNRMKARSIAAQNSLNVEAGLVDLRSDIEQAVQEFRTAYSNARAVGDKQLKTAESVLNAIKEAKNLGGRPLVDLLDAEREFRDTYRTYISNRANYWRALYKFSAAVGKQIQPGQASQP